MLLTLVVCWSAGGHAPAHLSVGPPRLDAWSLDARRFDARRLDGAWADTTDSARALPGPRSRRARPRPAVARSTTARDTTERDTTERDSSALAPRDTTRRDTTRRDTTRRDTTRREDADRLARLADSLAQADTGRTRRYLGPFRRRTPGPFDRRVSLLSPRRAPDERRSVAYDSTTQRFVATYDDPTYDERRPLAFEADDYERLRRQRALEAGWRELAERRQRERRRRGGVGVSIVVPGGRQSAFSTIFGKPEVDLRITGTADIDAGFDYRKSDQQGAITGDPSRLDPQFAQELRLGITGTIGDKMQIDVDWDTQNEFDYENQVRLKYTGYEDEIIQSVEAGNVFLDTPSQLINGGQSLFGLKAQFRLGNLQLTTIASQQEGQAQTLSIEGGSQAQSFSIKPTDYDADRHFFLGYFFRNAWERGFADPPGFLLQGGFNRITGVRVWKRVGEESNDGADGSRNVIALVDLAEDPAILEQGGDYTDRVLPNPAVHQYTAAEIAELRDGDREFSQEELEERFGLSTVDVATGTFIEVDPSQYDFDPQLGFISLNQGLNDNEALAVTYAYESVSGTVTVGDLIDAGNEGGATADRLVLKLLHPIGEQTPNVETGEGPAYWYLELRNIYNLRGRGFTSDNFSLELNYQFGSDPPQPVVPEISGQDLLIQTLGLDRLNEDRAPQPDTRFDFVPGYTIDPGQGLLIFPTLEPFGATIRRAILDNGGTEDLVNEYAFESLYRLQQQTARSERGDLDVYRIEGEYSGASQSFYDLRAFTGVVQGSVRVTSGGNTLTEGADYVVDYQGGTVNITNPQYLTDGRDVEIEYEQNTFAQLQQKTLLGARADWALRDRFALGATLFRLSERSPVDKFRVGEEPIRNIIWGVDGSANLTPRWLTRAVDALPLVQTRAESRLDVSGEFAQLRPGHTDTRAFEEARAELQDQGLDYSSDELGGVSFIDDFEGFENTFSLRQPTGWRLASGPVGAAEGQIERTIAPDTRFDDEAAARTAWRGLFAWYQVNRNLLDDLGVDEDDPAVGLVDVRDVFPNRDTRGEADPTITTLDLYFDPATRGPYNYTTDLNGFLASPEDVWGGFTQPIPDGFNDFSVQNIEFVEFIVRPLVEGGADAGPDARLLLDLGSISEDVLPNGTLNNEDGLSTDADATYTLDRWGRTRGSGPLDQIVTIRDGRTDDLGLDGLVSYDPTAYPTELDEATQFADFLSALPTSGSPDLMAQVERARLDPSADDYRFFGDDAFFGDPALFPGGATVQERFAFYQAGLELNSYEGQNVFGGGARGVTRQVDSEDLNFDARASTANNYFEYELPLSRAALDDLARPEASDDYVVGEIQDRNGNGTGWYQVRIPIRDATRTVGEPDTTFARIESLRFWTTGHERPITMRLASLELVGSQWRVSQNVREEVLQDPPPDDDEEDDDAPPAVLTPEALAAEPLAIASVNNEEDGVYLSPPGVIVARNQNARGGGFQNSREQALVLRAEELEPGQQRGVFRTFGQAFNLLKYSNLRLYAHVHGDRGDNGRPLHDPGSDTRGQPIDPRAQVKLFVRLGSNESRDYYEYEQPLTPSDLNERDALQLWRPTENSVNIELAALNQLKVARDANGALGEEVFWNVDATTGEVAPGAPDAEAFAPPGTRIGIRGRPSLRSVNTIIVGVRPGDSIDQEGELDEVVLWVNELRVSGYDERVGWAAVANANIDLADFATVSSNVRRTTDGFGALGSTLSQREQRDFTSWNVSTEVFLDKLLPERQGWSIPVSVQVSSSSETPRFDPVRGDVRLEEVLAGTDEAQRDSVRQAARTTSLSRSIRADVRKQGSTSKLLRYTVDALSLSTSYADESRQNPSNALNDRWSWNGAFDYQLDLGRPRTFKPFGFVGGLPVLGDLRFNVMPSRLTFSASARRNVTRQQTRPSPQGAGATSQPAEVLNPVRDTHGFEHTRTFDMQYSPFEFLNLTFGTNTSQSLDLVGADTTSTVLVLNRDGTQVVERLPGTIRDLRRDSVIVVEPDQGQPGEGEPGEEEPGGGDVAPTAAKQAPITVADPSQLVQHDRLAIRREGAVARDLFFGNASPRTEQYQQRFSATLRSSLLASQRFDWIDLQDISYSAGFQWRNSARGQNLGASVGNSVSISSGLSFHPNKVWERFGFYRRMKEAQDAADAEAQRERDRRRAASVRRRQERRQAREQEDEQAKDGQADDPTEEEQTDTPSQQGADDTGASGEERPDKKAPGDDGADPGESGDDGDDDDGPSLPDLPLPDVGGVLRRLALTFTDVPDLSVTYTSTRTASSSGVGRVTSCADDAQGINDCNVSVDYSLLDAFTGDGASLGYRFGFGRQVGADQRIVTDGRQAADDLSNDNRVEARTTLSPSSRLQVQLSWSANWRHGRTTTYRQQRLTDETGQPLPDDEANVLQTFTTEEGNQTVSTWAFAGGYRRLVEAQLATLAADLAATEDPALIRDDGDGRMALTNATLSDDFRDAYLLGLGTVDGRGFMPFPLPNWNLNYSGLSSWPLARRLTQSINLRHVYSATYGLTYRTLVSPDSSFTFGGRTVAYDPGTFEVTSPVINERLEPLVGLDVTWKGGVQTNLAWSRVNELRLGTTGAEIVENRTRELSLSARYTKNGLSLPLIPGRLNNQISFSLNVTRAVTDESRFLLRRALGEALAEAASTGGSVTDYDVSRALEGDNAVLVNQTTRLTVTPNFSYQLSNRVVADFLVQYERFDGDARQPSYTAINGGFNVRVSVSEN